MFIKKKKMQETFENENFSHNKHQGGYFLNLDQIQTHLGNEVADKICNKMK